jgi:hypothetical protein
MIVIGFTPTSPDYASKCLVEMLRLSNKYKKGVARRELGDDLGGPWDIVVVTNVDNLTQIVDFCNSHKCSLLSITPTDNLKLIWSRVEEFAMQAGLL